MPFRATAAAELGGVLLVGSTFGSVEHFDWFGFAKVSS